ncbi:GNAT family N-acetyltransferase [Nocardia sp. NBC_01503]|uniref:GNAT family N-acetyltransferase n=1 Tax=Nocardia sp. NBC_01503 TaxID=2975997 RepID=UPI002E7AC67B|nr:GNAT family N-acetyltransferase [Nocardia sp. NBC_01503]WTL32754.1 GNAT family N-acetyltransferase [Nocardia sp. NBC_01503]
MTIGQQHLPAGIRFERFDAATARDHRADVEEIFRRAYVEEIASGRAFASPEAFMTRFDAYVSPSRASGFEMVMALWDDQLAGQAWGWPLGEGTAWWGGLELDADDNVSEFTAEDGTRTFALSEIMVCHEFTGKGLARALHDALLQGRHERRATLLVRPGNTRAYQTYLRWGWERVGTLRPSWPDAPQFDVLIKILRTE